MLMFLKLCWHIMITLRLAGFSTFHKLSRVSPKQIPFCTWILLYDWDFVLKTSINKLILIIHLSSSSPSFSLKLPPVISDLPFFTSPLKATAEVHAPGHHLSPSPALPAAPQQSPWSCYVRLLWLTAACLSLVLFAWSDCLQVSNILRNNTESLQPCLAALWGCAQAQLWFRLISTKHKVQYDVISHKPKHWTINLDLMMVLHEMFRDQQSDSTSP